jgi:hypothetical protein
MFTRPQTLDKRKMREAGFFLGLTQDSCRRFFFVFHRSRPDLDTGFREIRMREDQESAMVSDVRIGSLSTVHKGRI